MALLPYSSAPIRNYAPVFNVKTYGALGDNTNDDTTAIQAAMNAVTANGGGEVHLPAGTYKVTSSLVPASNMVIRGVGNKTVIAGNSATAFSIFQKQASLNSPITDLEICDLKIDGTNVTMLPANYNASNGKGIFLQYCLRLKIHGVYVYNTKTSGIGTDFLVDSTIDRCVVDTCGSAWSTGRVGANGIGIGTGAYLVEDWIVSNCIAKNCGNCGIMMEDQQLPSGVQSKGMTVANCYAFGCNVGFLNSGTSGVSFANCYATNSATHNFEVFTGDIGTLATARNPQDVTLTTCYSSNAGASSHGFYIFDAKNDGTLKGIDIRGCTATGNAIHGINFTNVNHFSAMNNRCYSNGQNGVNVTCTNAGSLITYLLISGNQCYNNGTSDGAHDGIRLATTAGSISNGTVSNNRCWDDQGTPTQRYGISTGNNVSNLFIDGNVVSGNKTAAMNITASTTHTITNNPGYNPVGDSAITVTASPFTYTAGNTPTDVYISGGTVSSIVKGGITLFALTNTSVHLEANQSLIVTYTVAPTMTADVY